MLLLYKFISGSLSIVFFLSKNRRLIADFTATRQVILTMGKDPNSIKIKIHKLSIINFICSYYAHTI